MWNEARLIVINLRLPAIPQLADLRVFFDGDCNKPAPARNPQLALLTAGRNAHYNKPEYVRNLHTD